MNASSMSPGVLAPALLGPSCPPRLSVCICTYNGENRLDRVLSALAAQDEPSDSWEVLVVDNASVDRTATLAAARLTECFGARGRLVHEPTPGLSHARRRAAGEARGELVCFLDDDNLAEPDFVRQVLLAFQRHPGAGSLGGKVLAEWESEPTALVKAVAAYALAICDLGDQPFAYEWVAQGPVGAGMCVRRDLLLAACEDPVFCAAVTGRKGASLASGDDMALAVRIHQAGYERRYEPALRLRHRLPAARMSKEYLLRLYDGIGRGQAAVRRLYARGGNNRLAAAMIGLKDYALWIGRALAGPRRVAGVADDGLLRDLNDMEKSLLRGRAAAAWAFALSGARTVAR